MITQEELKELLEYDENTGIFTWKISTNFKIKIGDIAGSLQIRGYRQITINKKRYLAHRLAWLYVYGEWSKGQIDHINGIRDDNRIENLRVVTPRENNQNQKCHRDGKLVGATYSKSSKKWQAAIRVKGKLKHLGCYNTELEAHEAYLKFLNNLTINN